MSLPRIVCILGVTGTGKSALAAELARGVKVGIINSDSRQTYRELPIITAQPDLREQEVAPHFLYGFLPANEQMDVGRFITLAQEAIDKVLNMNRLPVLVGGTGLYLRSLLYGLAPIPEIDLQTKKRIKEEYFHYGSYPLYKKLQQVDPDYAQKIHPNDGQRICRGLEVYISTGSSLTQWHEFQPKDARYDALKLGLAPEGDKEEFRKRLLERINAMLESGALKEVKNVLQVYGPEAPGLSGIGGPELISHIQGERTLEEAKEIWLQNTRAYAKRQLTWFKKESNVHWLHSSGDKQAKELLNSFGIKQISFPNT